jgi:hypothetical protein
MGPSDLIKDLACPIEWVKVCEEQELVLWLNFAWYAIACDLEVDREVRGLISYDGFAPSAFELESLDAGEIESTKTNVATWRQMATERYEKVYGRLYRQRALRRDEMAKHYAHRSLMSADVIADSKKRGDAVLRLAIDEMVQVRLLWAALNDVVSKQVVCNPLEAHRSPKAPAVALGQMFDRHVLLVAGNFNRPVGASYGEETNYLRFNLDLVNCHFHCYPILEKEYNEGEFKAYVQGWNYGLSS